jgi:hypothetical protein
VTHPTHLESESHCIAFVLDKRLSVERGWTSAFRSRDCAEMLDVVRKLGTQLDDALQEVFCGCVSQLPSWRHPSAGDGVGDSFSRSVGKLVERRRLVDEDELIKGHVPLVVRCFAAALHSPYSVKAYAIEGNENDLARR